MPYRDTDPPLDRLEQLERRMDATDERLAKGAEAFAAQRSRMAWFLAGMVVTILSAALAVGRILQRIDDTAVTQDVHQTRLEAVQDDLAETRIEIVRLRGAVERAEEDRKRLEMKLDQALEQGRRRPR